ncbi:MAG: aminopeptidase, partial [Flavobacteriales bacterium]|nr:aminopeptidase [Flavobacteriales bacterium]
IGNFSVIVNDYKRNSRLFHVRYSFSGQFFDYAPNAGYMKLNPMIQFRIRENDYRDNRKEAFIVRQVIVHREQTPYVELTEENSNYSVFNLKYFNIKTEVQNHYGLKTDLQIANSFGKVAIELEYRNLFENNRLLQLRLFAGSFLYRKTNSNFFSFALDRPTDYLFDYPLYGRSEKTGFFSQQYIIAEGAFKSKLATPFANQWMTTLNANMNVWNWIEVYGDLGWIKNEGTQPQFVYDSGIRLNLVTDYFELYLPVQSSNGWEISKPAYPERIRVMFTFTPEILVGLFTRKWF